MAKVKEYWKDIKGYEGKYKISNLGRVISINGRRKGEHIIKGNKCSSGYWVYTFRKPGINAVQIRLHRLIAIHFIYNDDPIVKTLVNHKDGNKLNNSISNLEWCTYLGNARHAVDTGLVDMKGENHKNSKLTNIKVINMRKMYATGEYLYSDLCKEFNICRRQCSDVILGKNWGWLEPSLNDIVEENRKNGIEPGWKYKYNPNKRVKQLRN